MANIRITDLDLIPFSSITVDDVFPLVDVSGNTTYKINLNQLNNYLSGFDSRWYIESGETITVRTNTQNFIYGDLIVNGELMLEDNSKLIVLNGDIIVSGGTISGAGNIILIDLPEFDTKVTDFTYNDNEFTISNNIGSSYSVSLNEVTGLTVNGNFSATTISASTIDLCGTNGILFTDTISGCSPINVLSFTNFHEGLSGITISGGTFYGDGSNLSGIFTQDIFVTGGTYTNGEILFKNNSGGTFTVTGLPIGGAGGEVYYLNLSQTQTPYQEFSPIGTNGVEQTTGVTINSGVTSTIASFLTPTGYPNTTTIPAGVWSFYLHSYKDVINSSFEVFCEVYVYTTGGTETLILTTAPTEVTTYNPTTSMELTDGYYSGSTIDITDRILVKIKTTNTGSQTNTITFFTEGQQNYSYGITPFSNFNALTCETLSGCTTIINLENNKVNKNGDTMTGTLFVPTISATTISGGTFYGDGSNLLGSITGGTNLGGGLPIFNNTQNKNLEFNSITGDTLDKISTTLNSNKIEIGINEPNLDIWPLVVKGSKLLNGGVSYISGYTFEVSPLEYIIGETIYSITSSSTVVLNSGDSTYDRIDVIISDVFGNTSVIQGTPSLNPEKPNIDELTQLEITFILVPANSIEPDITTLILYNNNLGTPTEWSFGSVGSQPTRIISSATEQTYSGSTSIRVSGVTGAFTTSFRLTGLTTVDTTNYSSLQFAIRNLSANTTTTQIRFRFLTSTGTQNGSAVFMNAAGSSNFVQYNNTNTSSWQVISIPLWRFYLTNNFAQILEVSFNSPNARYYFDLIELLEGYSSSPPVNSWTAIKGDGTTTITAPNPNATLTISGGTNISSSISGSSTVVLNLDNNISLNSVSATTISGGTFYGDGSNLTGIGGGGNFLPLSGGTVTGDTIFTQNITANTVNSLRLGIGGGNINSNISLGTNSLQSNTTGCYNVSLGQSSLLNNTTGCNNVSLGRNSLLSNTTGSNNVSLGLCSLQSNTTGVNNISLGRYSLQFNTTGINNISLGGASLYSNTTGCNNVSLGNSSLLSNTTGCNNVSLGNNSLRSNTTGCYNVALGLGPLLNNTTGCNNISLGNRSLYFNTTGCNNISLGLCSLRCNTTGCNNVSLGFLSLLNNTTGYQNLSLGLLSLLNNTTGSFNTSLGSNSLQNNTTGCNNVSLGRESLRCNTTGINNVSLGCASLCSNTTGYQNVSLGQDSLRSNTTGGRNVSIGVSSLSYNTTGTYNVSLGFNSLRANTTGIHNFSAGRTALSTNTVGGDNVAIGNRALFVNTSGCTNIAIGRYSLRANTIGCNNVSLGNSSLRYNTTGNYNVALGRYSLRNNTTGNYNVALGQGSLCSNTTGCYNVALGKCNLRNNTTGCYNVALGLFSLSSNTSGGDNVALGRSALQNNTTGCNNIAIGCTSLLLNTTGNNNTSLGRDTLRSNTTGSNNVALGTSTLRYNTTGCFNVALGTESLRSNTTGGCNIALGPSTLRCNTTGGDNVALGYTSLRSNTTGCNNISLGRESLLSNTTGCNNVALGSRSLRSNTTGFQNISLGYSSLLSNTTGGCNIALGPSTLRLNTTGCNNVALGYYSLCSNTTGNYNVALGRESLRYNTTGIFNVALGDLALRSNTTGIFNVALGRNSLLGNTTGGNNVALGQSALRFNTTGCNNVALGSGSLFFNTTGNSNVALGPNTLLYNTTGSFNVALGQCSLSLNTTGANNVALGNCSQTGNFSGSTILGSFAVATANQQFVLGSSTIPIGPIATESCTSNKTLQINLNGNLYKLLLFQ